MIIRDKKFNVLLKINCALPTQQCVPQTFTIINSAPVHTVIVFKLITAVHIQVTLFEKLEYVSFSLYNDLYKRKDSQCLI